MSSNQQQSTSTGNPNQSGGFKVRHGVFIRTDPVLKVYIEHTLNQERQGNVDSHLYASQDLSLDDQHLLLTNSTPIDAEKIDLGLKQVVGDWLKFNSFAQLDDEGSDDEVLIDE